MAAHGSWFEVENKDFLNCWNCIFVLQSRISYLGYAEGEARPLFMAALFRSQCSSCISLAHHTYLCYLLLLVLSTETLVQKLLVYMKHFLIRLEIDTFSSYKFDGDDRLLTIVLEDRGINIVFLNGGDSCSLFLLKRELRLEFSEQHAKRSYSPFPKPNSSFP